MAGFSPSGGAGVGGAYRPMAQALAAKPGPARPGKAGPNRPPKLQAPFQYELQRYHNPTGSPQQGSVTKPSGASTVGGAAGGTSAGTQPPLDTQYFQNVAANQFKVGQQINALNLKQSQDQQALQAQLAQLAYAQPRASLALEQQANARGGLYSSVYDQNLGNLQYQYAGKQGADQNAYANAARAIAAQIAGLNSSIPIYNQGQAFAAAERATTLAQKNPAAGEPTTSTPAGSLPPGVLARIERTYQAGRAAQARRLAAAMAAHRNRGRR